jgi:hypothetical protein
MVYSESLLIIFVEHLRGNNATATYNPKMTQGGFRDWPSSIHYSCQRFSNFAIDSIIAENARMSRIIICDLAL